MSVNSTESVKVSSWNNIAEDNNNLSYSEYEIKKWDTLWVIAKRNWISIKDIQEFNWIKDVNKIYAWKKLKIPKKQEMKQTQREENLTNVNGTKSSGSTLWEWSTSKVDSPVETTPEIQELLWKLDYRNIQNITPDEIKSIIATLKKLFDEWKVSQEQIASSIIPPTEYIACLFYSDKFIRTLQERAQTLAWRNDPYSKRYMEYYRVSWIAKDNQRKHLIVFSEYARVFWKWVDYSKESDIFKDKNEWVLPKYWELHLNHDDAIDVFFRNVRREWNEEIWPSIYSKSSWIVVASRNDWKWGTTEWQYISWWISPRSWNWVIVFNPLTNEYYEYSHLNSSYVKAWDIIEAWTLLWIWWNSWLNARKAWHWWHLHYSIHKYTEDWKTVTASAESLYSNVKWRTQLAFLK